MTRIEAITRLTEITDQLNADELRVLAKFGRKILNGSVKHGHMDLINDTRDWSLEQQDERVDDACYGYMREVQAELRAEKRAATDPASVGLREDFDESGDSDYDWERDQLHVEQGYGDPTGGDA